MFDQSEEVFLSNSTVKLQVHYMLKKTSYLNKYVDFEMNAYSIHLINRMFDIFVEFGFLLV